MAQSVIYWENQISSNTFNLFDSDIEKFYINFYYTITTLYKDTGTTPTSYPGKIDLYKS